MQQRVVDPVFAKECQYYSANEKYIDDNNIFGIEKSQKLLYSLGKLIESRKNGIREDQKFVKAVISIDSMDEIINEIRNDSQYDNYENQLNHLEMATYLYKKILTDYKYINRYGQYLNNIMMDVIKAKKNKEYKTRFDFEEVNQINDKIKKKRTKKKIIRFLTFGIFGY